MALTSVRTARAQWSQVIPTTSWVSMKLMTVPSVCCAPGWSQGLGWMPVVSGGVWGSEPLPAPTGSGGGVLRLSGALGVRLGRLLRGPQPQPGEDGAGGGDPGGTQQPGGEP